MLQFITNTDVKLPVVEQIKLAIEGGCRWIQIRMKDAGDEDISRIVEQVKPLCLETESFLILNDRVELAKKLDVGGVHLGKDDMPPSQARMMLGPAAIIGVTANTFDEIQSKMNLDIDYFGIGPYSSTTTKRNLAPLLGLEGIQKIVKQARQNNVEQPLVAVGGIHLEDVEPLMQAGVNGIAVSGAIAAASYPKKATAEFIRMLGHT